MTARLSAYAEALRRAGGMTGGPAGDEDATAVAAEPRPRSLFEETEDDALPGPLPRPADDASVLPSVAPAVGRPWGDETSADGPPSVHAAPGGAPRPEQDLPGGLAERPRRPDAPVGDGERPRDDRESPLPVVRTELPPPASRQSAEGPSRADAAPPPAVPVTRPAPAPEAPPTAPAPGPVVEGGDAVPVRAAAAPAHPAPAAEPAAVSDVVRAQPLTVEPDSGTPPAVGAETEPAPVVVEIGRVEVRIVADRAPAPPRERGPRPRTGPSLEQYLLESGPAGAARRGAS
ncbi:hypothetical protein [Streptomyces sp. I05A-00742]|uniref:hypothetical protein n=1 Tax=Streptomyces sp. I05A-00742 TaxID=2732853 RepID=UPI0014898BC0|nr:hypothetical protein [Streptomyces sp. I05A-00742]